MTRPSSPGETSGLAAAVFPVTVWKLREEPGGDDLVLESFSESARDLLAGGDRPDPRGSSLESLLPSLGEAGGTNLCLETLRSGKVRELAVAGFGSVLALPLADRRVGLVMEAARDAFPEEDRRRSGAPFRALALKFQEAREQERTALAREIHDVLGQELTMLKLDVAYFLEKVAPESARDFAGTGVGPKEIAARIDRLVTTVRRIASDLRPAVLDYAGLSDAIEEETYQMAGLTGLKVRFESTLRGERFETPVSTAAFRILQEALTNIVRHAAARSVEVRLFLAGDLLALEVEDDGRGFDPLTLTRPESLGFLGMRERASALHGSLEVDSEPGRGTLVRLRIPVSAGGGRTEG